MSRRWTGLGLLGVGASLLSACAGEQVWLGEARLDITDCEATECADAGPGGAPAAPTVVPPTAPPSVMPPTPPWADPEQPPLVDVAVKDRCNVPVTGELTVEHRVTSVPADCGKEPGADCAFGAKDLEPTADGGVWVVANITNVLAPVPSIPSQWLLRFDAAGALHCKIALTSSFHLLAADDSSHAWLTVPDARRPEFAEVQRYDEDCNALGGRLAGLNQVHAIKNMPGAGVAIVNGISNPVLSLHDQSGQTLWSRPRPPSTGRYYAALATSASSAFVLGISPRRGGGGGVTVDALDALGNERWQTISEANNWLGLQRNFQGGSDQQGNLVLALIPSDVLGQRDVTYSVDVESIDASGRTRWVLRLPSSGNPGVAVAPSGEVFVTGPERRPTNDERATLMEIAQDGSSCRRLGYAGSGWIQDMAVSPTGRLWFADSDGFGRFGPIP